jgi:hypothetical protein
MEEPPRPYLVDREQFLSLEKRIHDLEVEMIGITNSMKRIWSHVAVSASGTKQ